jgi:2-oxoglutarate dehydrogenase E1 component
MPVIRVEQLYPWPDDALAAEIARYPNLTEVVWLQEEPANMGPWNAVKGYLFEGLGESIRVRRVSRSPEASPATGSHAIHVQEQSQILDRAFAAFT